MPEPIRAAAISGTLARSSETVPSRPTMRMPPVRKLTSILPSGRKAMPHGRSILATVSTA